MPGRGRLGLLVPGSVGRFALCETGERYVPANLLFHWRTPCGLFGSATLAAPRLIGAGGGAAGALHSEPNACSQRAGRVVPGSRGWVWLCLAVWGASLCAGRVVCQENCLVPDMLGASLCGRRVVIGFAFNARFVVTNYTVSDS